MRDQPIVDQAQASPPVKGVTLGLAAVLLAAGLVILIPTTSAQEQAIPAATLTPGDLAAGDEMGASVAIDGDRAVVGAIDENNDRGAAYVFEYVGGTWVEEARLTATEPSPGDHFGSSVAIEHRTVFVGAIGETTVQGNRSGAVYIFEEQSGTWVTEQRLVPNDVESSDGFGASMDLDGDRAVVGAPFADAGASTSVGAAWTYVYDAPSDTWERDEKLTADVPSDSDGFGASVAISGADVLVGSIFAEDAGVQKGAVYAFTVQNGAWDQIDRLLASDGEDLDRFGRAVDIDGDRAVIGAPEEDSQGDGAGAVYIFDDLGTFWSESGKVTVPPIDEDDALGRAVAIHGNTLFAGASRAEDADGEETGQAYVITQDPNTGDWVVEANLSPEDPDPFGNFGRVLDAHGDHVVVGAPSADTTDGETSGQVYAFSGTPVDLRATPGAETGTIELDWATPSQATLGLSYLVFRKTSSPAEFTEIAETDALRYSDTGLANQTYDYMVRAQRGSTGFASDPSNQVSAHPRPPAPDALQASGGERVGEIDLTWQAPSGVQGDLDYRVYRSTEAGGPYTQVAQPVSPGYTDDELSAGTYHYVVTSLDASGLESPLSQEASAQPAGAAGQPPGDADGAQNDAGTGGDASDDPDDPTILSGGTLIHINGTLMPIQDPVDAYGTQIDPDATRSMAFLFTSPVSMELDLSLVAPDGSLVDTAQAPVGGGPVNVSVEAPAGQHLDAGTWVTILRHGQAPPPLLSAPPPPTTGSAPGPWALDHPEAPAGAYATPALPFTDGGVTPSVLPGPLAALDYRDERPCDPYC